MKSVGRGMEVGAITKRGEGTSSRYKEAERKGKIIWEGEIRWDGGVGEGGRRRVA